MVAPQSSSCPPLTCCANRLLRVASGRGTGINAGAVPGASISRGQRQNPTRPSKGRIASSPSSKLSINGSLPDAGARETHGATENGAACAEADGTAPDAADDLLETALGSAAIGTFAGGLSAT